MQSEAEVWAAERARVKARASRERRPAWVRSSWWLVILAVVMVHVAGRGLGWW